jgi:DNA mismatch repair ATPase MutS
LSLNKPNAKALVQQLVPLNPLGYVPNSGQFREGTLLNYVIQEKKKHLDKILLVRCGDFYETYGIDAIMLVEYAGLNPMAGKARAGCPAKNIQATLDSLVEAGLVVAVYEEINDNVIDKSPNSKVSIVHNDTIYIYIYV